MKALGKTTGVTCAGTPMPADHVRDQGRLAGVFLYSCPPSWLKTGSLTEPKFTFLARVSGKLALGIYLSLPSQCWDDRDMQPYLAFHLGAQVSNSRSLHVCRARAPTQGGSPWKAVFTSNPPPQKTEHMPTESWECISLTGMHLSDIHLNFGSIHILIISPQTTFAKLHYDIALKLSIQI